MHAARLHVCSVLLACATALAARAAAAPATPPPPAIGPLDGLRQQLGTLTPLERGLSSPASGSAPATITMPGLHLAPDAPPPRAPTGPAKKIGPDGKTITRSSANWLVDAMQRPDDKNDPLARSAALTLDPNADPANDPAAATDSPGGPRQPSSVRGQDREPDSRAADASSPATASPNPLDGFLKNWMTPRDFALLQPGDRAAPASAPGNDSVTDFRPSSAFTAAPAIGASLRPDTTANAFAPSSASFAAPANPYLEMFAAPPSSAPPSLAPVSAFSSAGNFGSAPPPAASSTAASPPRPPAAPYVPPPATDTKYFPQLKKF